MKNRIRKKTRKIINRSGQRECPICNQKEILVEHHIKGKNIPNANHLSNLAYICDNCHRKIHEGIIILEKYVQTTSGLELFWHKNGTESMTGENARPYLIGS